MDLQESKLLLDNAVPLLAGIGKMFNNADYNSWNVKLANMTNQLTREQYNKEVANQWAQIEYNTPYNQRQRLEAAGLNPYLLMSSGGANMGSASQSVPHANAFTTPQVSPTFDNVSAQFFSQVGEQLFHLTEQFHKVEGLKKDNEKKTIENSRYAEILQKQIDNMLQDTKSKKEETFLKDIQNQILDMSFDSIVNQYKSNEELTRQQKNLTAAQQIETMMRGLLNYKSLQYFDANAMAQLSLNAAQVYSLYASGQLSYAQMSLAVANTIKTNAETNGIKLNNDILQETKDALIKSARNAVNANATFSDPFSSIWLKFNNTYIKPILQDSNSSSQTFLNIMKAFRGK